MAKTNIKNLVVNFSNKVSTPVDMFLWNDSPLTNKLARLCGYAHVEANVSSVNIHNIDYDYVDKDMLFLTVGDGSVYTTTTDTSADTIIAFGKNNERTGGSYIDTGLAVGAAILKMFITASDKAFYGVGKTSSGDAAVDVYYYINKNNSYDLGSIVTTSPTVLDIEGHDAPNEKDIEDLVETVDLDEEDEDSIITSGSAYLSFLNTASIKQDVHPMYESSIIHPEVTNNQKYVWHNKNTDDKDVYEYTYITTIDTPEGEKKYGIRMNHATIDGTNLIGNIKGQVVTLNSLIHKEYIYEYKNGPQYAQIRPDFFNGKNTFDNGDGDGMKITNVLSKFSSSYEFYFGKDTIKSSNSEYTVYDDETLAIAIDNSDFDRSNYGFIAYGSTAQWTDKHEAVNVRNIRELKNLVDDPSPDADIYRKIDQTYMFRVSYTYTAQSNFSNLTEAQNNGRYPFIKYNIYQEIESIEGIDTHIKYSDLLQCVKPNESTTSEQSVMSPEEYEESYPDYLYQRVQVSDSQWELSEYTWSMLVNSMPNSTMEYLEKLSDTIAQGVSGDVYVDVGRREYLEIDILDYINQVSADPRAYCSYAVYYDRMATGTTFTASYTSATDDIPGSYAVISTASTMSYIVDMSTLEGGIYARKDEDGVWQPFDTEYFNKNIEKFRMLPEQPLGSYEEEAPGLGNYIDLYYSDFSFIPTNGTRINYTLIDDALAKTIMAIPQFETMQFFEKDANGKFVPHALDLSVDNPFEGHEVYVIDNNNDRVSNEYNVIYEPVFERVNATTLGDLTSLDKQQHDVYYVRKETYSKLSGANTTSAFFDMVCANSELDFYGDEADGVDMYYRYDVKSDSYIPYTLADARRMEYLPMDLWCKNITYESIPSVAYAVMYDETSISGMQATEESRIQDIYVRKFNYLDVTDKVHHGTISYSSEFFLKVEDEMTYVPVRVGIVRDGSVKYYGNNYIEVVGLEDYDAIDKYTAKSEDNIIYYKSKYKPLTRDEFYKLGPDVTIYTNSTDTHKSLKKNYLDGDGKPDMKLKLAEMTFVKIVPFTSSEKRKYDDLNSADGTSKFDEIDVVDIKIDGSKVYVDMHGKIYDITALRNAIYLEPDKITKGDDRLYGWFEYDMNFKYQGKRDELLWRDDVFYFIKYYGDDNYLHSYTKFDWLEGEAAEREWCGAQYGSTGTFYLFKDYLEIWYGNVFTENYNGPVRVRADYGANGHFQYVKDASSITEAGGTIDPTTRKPFFNVTEYGVYEGARYYIRKQTCIPTHDIHMHPTKDYYSAPKNVSIISETDLMPLTAIQWTASESTIGDKVEMISSFVRIDITEAGLYEDLYKQVSSPVAISPQDKYFAELVYRETSIPLKRSIDDGVGGQTFTNATKEQIEAFIGGDTHEVTSLYIDGWVPVGGVAKLYELIEGEDVDSIVVAFADKKFVKVDEEGMTSISDFLSSQGDGQPSRLIDDPTKRYRQDETLFINKYPFNSTKGGGQYVIDWDSIQYFGRNSVYYTLTSESTTDLNDIADCDYKYLYSKYFYNTYIVNSGLKIDKSGNFYTKIGVFDGTLGVSAKNVILNQISIQLTDYKYTYSYTHYIPQTQNALINLPETEWDNYYIVSYGTYMLASTEVNGMDQDKMSFTELTTNGIIPSMSLDDLIDNYCSVTSLASVNASPYSYYMDNVQVFRKRKCKSTERVYPLNDINYPMSKSNGMLLGTINVELPNVFYDAADGIVDLRSSQEPLTDLQKVQRISKCAGDASKNSKLYRIVEVKEEIDVDDNVYDADVRVWRDRGITYNTIYKPDPFAVKNDTDVVFSGSYTWHNSKHTYVFVPDTNEAGEFTGSYTEKEVIDYLGYWSKDYTIENKPLHVSSYNFYVGQGADSITSTISYLPNTYVLSAVIEHPEVTYNALISNYREVPIYTYAIKGVEYNYGGHVVEQDGKYYGLVCQNSYVAYTGSYEDVMAPIELTRSNQISVTSETGTYMYQQAHTSYQYISYKTAVALTNETIPVLYNSTLIPAKTEDVMVYDEINERYSIQTRITQNAYYAYDYWYEKMPFYVASYLFKSSEFTLDNLDDLTAMVGYAYATLSSYIYDQMTSIRDMSYQMSRDINREVDENSINSYRLATYLFDFSYSMDSRIAYESAVTNSNLSYHDEHLAYTLDSFNASLTDATSYGAYAMFNMLYQTNYDIAYNTIYTSEMLHEDLIESRNTLHDDTFMSPIVHTDSVAYDLVTSYPYAMRDVLDGRTLSTMSDLLHDSFTYTYIYTKPTAYGFTYQYSYKGISDMLAQLHVAHAIPTHQEFIVDMTQRLYANIDFEYTYWINPTNVARRCIQRSEALWDELLKRGYVE